MAQINKNKSFRESVLTDIESFLFKEKFMTADTVPLGILEAINLISDYHEEGVALYPEIVMTNSLEFFRTVPNKKLLISVDNLTIDGFKKAIKLCAPLAIDSWVIFIVVLEDSMQYGLISAEMTETSLSLYRQTVGALKVDYAGMKIAYIRNVGQKTVELVGLDNKLTISFSLNFSTEISLNEIELISNVIISCCESNIKTQLSTFFEKIISEAFRVGHGNLVAVVNETEEDIDRLKATEQNGTFLEIPVDFYRLIQEAEDEKSNESSFNLRSYSSILKAMLNHDGITIFTNKGKLIGYHLLINSYEKEGDSNIGGARSKAFASMKNCDLFMACLYKSQDGNMKIWKRDE